MGAPGLKDIVAELSRLYPVGEILTAPLDLILWENIGYLIDDDRRQILFQAFQDRVSLSPQAIAAADGAVLLDIARRGGMRPETRVERWREIARISLDRCGGDLEGALRALPLPKARALLKAFPVIGDPGADKVLLFSGISPQPCLDSNGVRVLVRLGLVAEQRSYAATYRAAVEVLKAQGPSDRDGLIAIFVALREHGKALCKRGGPLCAACSLDPLCAHRMADAL